MPHVLEDEVVDLFAEAAELLDQVAGLALDDAWVVLALDHEQRARGLGDTGPGRALDEVVAVAVRIADREGEVRLQVSGIRFMNVSRS